MQADTAGLGEKLLVLLLPLPIGSADSAQLLTSFQPFLTHVGFRPWCVIRHALGIILWTRPGPSFHKGGIGLVPYLASLHTISVVACYKYISMS
jgi:hypothetical protein